MTNVRRPIHLQLRSPSSGAPSIGSPKALSPAADSLPSQILPHLFVGNQEQTNRETVNRLNISYILSLGLLPLISASSSPTSPTSNASQQQQQQQQSPQTQQQQQQISMPSRNSSKDFKIRLRTNGTPPSYGMMAAAAPSLAASSCSNSNNNNNNNANSSGGGGGGQLMQLDRDENKGVKQIRPIQCKCINIADSSEQILSKFFDEAHQFIDEARRKKCNILVHCQAGISRSPTIAIAYLMRVNSLPLQDAYNLVKQCRPQTDPNLSFMGQLMIYEKSLEEAKKQQRQLQSQPPPPPLPGPRGKLQNSSKDSKLL